MNPVNVLIIDDSSEKAREVASCLSGMEGYSSDTISVVTNVVDAKRAISKTQYDLVILDINLPLRAEEDPVMNGGMLLLDEVLSRGIFKRPKHFVGLTAHEEVYSEAADHFGNELWSVIQYKANSDEWKARLSSKARHVWVSENVSDEIRDGFYTDICIITALEEPELEAVLALPIEWLQLNKAGDPTIYYQGTVTTTDGVQKSLIAARSPLMGMPAAAVLATKIIFQFRPRCLVMAGICAGSYDEVSLGDVVVANPCWDYGSGKYSTSNLGDKIFEPSTYQVSLQSRVRSSVERLQKDRACLDGIRNGYPGTKPKTAFQLHLGPLASGAAVLADQDLFDQIKDKQHRKLLAIDMEAYAVMAAAAEMPAPQPEVLVLKGVSDFADKDKGDKLRHYAAYASANTLLNLITRYSL